MDDVAASGRRRGARLAGIPLAHAGRLVAGVGKRLGGLPAERIANEIQAATAAQIFGVLGELKGGAMKFGQALSAMEAVMPTDLGDAYRQAFVALQEHAAPMPTSVVHQVLREEFGAGWRDRFGRFDDRPVAAASLGQVHRALWHDGSEVAVKIQYPGVADALRADLDQLDRLAPLMRIGVPKVDARELLGQLRDRLVEELDYEHEASVQRRFARSLRAEPRLVVPDVLDATGRVLVAEWADAAPLAEIIDHGSRSQRDTAGELLLTLFLSAPSLVGRVHGDPHPGNFRLRDDGALVVFDFGSSETMGDGWPPALARLLRAGSECDAPTLHATMVRSHLIDADDIGPDQLLDVLDAWFEPLRRDRFHFDRRWIQARTREWSTPRSAAGKLQRRLRIPPQHLLVQRVGFGLLGVLTSLDATVEVRSQVRRWLPGASP